MSYFCSMKNSTNIIQKAEFVLRKIKHSILDPVSDEMCSFFLFFLIFSYVIAFTGIYLGIPVSWFLSVLLPIFDCYLLCCVIRCFSLIRLRYVGWLFVFLIALVFFGELFTVFLYRSFYSIYVIQLVLETDSRESLEFLSSALLQSALWYSVTGLVLASVVSYSLTCLVQRPFRYRVVLSWFTFAIILWSGVRQLSAYKKICQTFVNPDITLLDNNSNRMPRLNSPLVRLLHGIAYNKAQTTRLDKLQTSMEETTVDSCSFRSPIILLVIGESYNKHHAHIYNPSYLPTTPRLEKLQASGSLTVLNDVVSPSNSTSEVFKNLFSLWDEGCDEDWTQFPLFPALFKKAGYGVWFFSNQFTINSLNYYNVVGGTIFNRPRLSDLQFTYRNTTSYEYDLDLLQELPSSDTLVLHSTLLIVHLIGQHVKFHARYPSEYAHFQPCDEQTTFGGETGKKIASQYDNATYYNDVVVDSLFRIFKDMECVGIYFADHGEEAYDWRPSSGRTGEAEMTREVARNQYEIPFMFYTSDTYIARHPDIVKQIKEAVDKPYLSTDLAHLLLYLGGIQTSLYKESLNILSPKYNTGRKRIIHGNTDYDMLMGRKEADESKE